MADATVNADGRLGPQAEPSAPVGGLSARGISKAFGSTQALTDVDLTLTPGRVHALLGANGCGKSTLVKVLAGVHEPDAGKIEWAGGGRSIAFVHQDLALIEGLGIDENLALASSGGYAMSAGRIHWRRARDRARDALAAVGLDLDPRRTVSEFGPAERTMIAVARALMSLPGEGGVLVLDEPTARLPAAEADRLVEMLAGLRERSVAILYISHRIEEILALADELTVLRDGRVVFHEVADGLSRDELVRMVVGREVVVPVRTSRTAASTLLLQLRNVSGMRLRDVSLTLHRGEVLGVAGLVGSGRSELARIVYGVQAPLAGHVVLDDEDLTTAPVAARMDRGMAYVPQERAEGLFNSMSVGENAVLPDLRTLMGGLMISTRRVQEAADSVVRTMHVRTAGTEVPVGTLSGGNQQKVSLGKWMRRDPILMVLDEPTQGIDVGARTEIFGAIRKLATEGGSGVLVMDSDLEILADFCDRAVVMMAGRLGTSFAGEDLTAGALSRAVYGH